jgi:hypothetical protein
VVATVVATRADQRLQPPPRRLVRRQQRFVEAIGPQRGFEARNDGVLCRL